MKQPTGVIEILIVDILRETRCETKSDLVILLREVHHFRTNDRHVTNAIKRLIRKGQVERVWPHRENCYERAYYALTVTF